MSDTAGTQLEGGMGNGGAVVRIGDTVRRPAGPRPRTTSLLLAELARVGFPAPVPIGVEDPGWALFRWIDGEVPVPPYPAWSLSDEALASVGRLLRRYHEVVGGISLPARLDFSPGVADPHGGSTICHNDVCPENVVFRSGGAAALLDFDLAAPGRPVWDLAQTARMWIPLRPPELAGDRAHLDPFTRLAVLAHAYRLEPADRPRLIEAIIESKRVGSRFVENRANAGEPAFVAAWEGLGGAAGDAQTVRWLEDNADAFLRRLAGRPHTSKCG